MRELLVGRLFQFQRIFLIIKLFIAIPAAIIANPTLDAAVAIIML